MSELPVVSGKRSIRAFKKAGFAVVRQKGSHHIMSKPGHPYVLSVPVHGNKALKPGTLRGLISASGLSVDEFVASL